MKKSTTLIVWFVVLIVVTSMIGPYDMELSQRLQEFPQWFGRFFEIFGMLPFFLVIMVLGYTFFDDLNPSSHGKVTPPGVTTTLMGIPAKIYVPLVVLVFFGAAAIGVGSTLHYLFIDISVLMYLPVSVVVALPLTWAAWNNRGKYFLNFSRKGVLLGVLFLVTILLFNQVGKALWGRVRPRDLMDITQFTPWFLPQGVTGNASFPSAHATFATAGVALLYVVPKGRLWHRLLVGSLLWGGATAVARIIVGAHFPTDVIMGVGSTLGIYLWVLWYGEGLITRWVLPRNLRQER